MPTSELSCFDHPTVLRIVLYWYDTQYSYPTSLRIATRPLFAAAAAKLLYTPSLPGVCTAVYPSYNNPVYKGGLNFKQLGGGDTEHFDTTCTIRLMSGEYSIVTPGLAPTYFEVPGMGDDDNRALSIA